MFETLVQSCTIRTALHNSYSPVQFVQSVTSFQQFTTDRSCVVTA
jgi:hypothetical protein